MTDKKLTDEEIIKALEDYIKENEFEYFHSNMMGEYPLIRKSLDIINRQKTKIERLKTENKIYIEANRVIGYQRDQRDKEIDEMQKQIDGLDIRENKIKSEAYKEFAERLCEGKVSNDKTVIEAKVLLEEMVGDEE